MGLIKFGAVPVGAKFTVDTSTLLTVLGLAAKAYMDWKAKDMNALLTDVIAIVAALGLSPITPPAPPAPGK